MNEDPHEFGIDGREVSLALVDGESGEPFEDGRPGIRVGLGVRGMGVRIVKRDVGGERVNELVLIHARIVRGFRVWIRHFVSQTGPNKREMEMAREMVPIFVSAQAESYTVPVLRPI